MKSKLCVFSSLSFLLIFVLFLSSNASAQTASNSGSSKSQTSTTTPSLPYTPSLDLNAMDKTIDPCVDFYHYACGGWQKANPIPPDRTSWSVYGKLYEDNLTLLRTLLEQAAKAKGRDAVTQKIGDFYGACMDESGVNRRGVAAIKPQLDAIAALKSTHELPSVIGRLQLAIERSPVLFGVGAIQDPDNSDQQIANLDQGGLGLPDRDYYTKDDPKSKEIRERYVMHVEKIFTLLGDAPRWR